MEDEQIVRLFWQRNEQAIPAAAEKYGAYCVSIAGNILASREDAEECVNDAYLQVWNSVPPQKPANLSAYLGRIVRNLALNRYKYNSAAKRGGGELPAVLEECSELLSGGTDTEKTFDRNELLRAVNGFLGGLTEKKRSIFLCRYWYADSIPMIAARFGMSENAVSASLSRSRARLRRYLTERGFDL